MNIGLLGTGFGRAHAAIYHNHPRVDRVVVFGRTPGKLAAVADQFGFDTTTDLDAIYGEPSIDLVDVCLPTPMHADHVIRALEAGKDVLCELPLASTMADARRIVAAESASGRHVFVDMFGRFDPVVEYLGGAITEGRYGALKTLEVEARSALLWEGYDLGLDSIVIDMMHASLDTIVTALGPPDSTSAIGVGGDGRGSAVEAWMSYPAAVATCRASSLMPSPYGVRGGYRATFTDAVLESAWTAGYDGRPTTSLTEWTQQGERPIELADIELYTAVIDHVFDCLQGHATSRIGPQTTIDTVEVTLTIHQKVNKQP